MLTDGKITSKDQHGETLENTIKEKTNTNSNA